MVSKATDVQVGTKGLAYADMNVLLSNDYREMLDLLETVNRLPVASKVKSELIPVEHHLAVLLGSNSLEGFENFKYLGSMFINLARFACNPLIAMFNGKSLLRSCASDSAPWMSNLAIHNRRRKTAGGLL